MLKERSAAAGADTDALVEEADHEADSHVKRFEEDLQPHAAMPTPLFAGMTP